VGAIEENEVVVHHSLCDAKLICFNVAKVSNMPLSIFRASVLLLVRVVMRAGCFAAFGKITLLVDVKAMFSHTKTFNSIRD
jgi:hypothetical protein